MLMSPNEAAAWIGRLEEIIEAREWEQAGNENSIRFWLSPSINIIDYSDSANCLLEPETFLPALRDVIQGLTDDLTN